MMDILNGGLNTFAKWISAVISGGGYESEGELSVDRALSYAPVWGCVSKITGAFMVMDLELLREQENKREEQEEHALYPLVEIKSNAYQTASQFKRLMVMHALLWGNARAFIVTHNGKPVSRGGIPVELLPLMPDRTDTAMVEGVKVHGTIVCKDDAMANVVSMGTDREKVVYFADEEIVHLPGLGYDGVKGCSLIKLASRTWSIGIGDEVQTQKQQKKGYAGGANIEAPAGVFRNQKDAQEFLEAYRKQHEGQENTGKIGLLREGMKLNVQAMSNADAQFIERRRLNREDVALQFCLEGILGDSTNASFNSLYEKNLAYRVNCLSPWTVAFEQELNCKLLKQSEIKQGYRFRFDDRTLLRMDANALMTFCSQAIAATILSPNECRDLLDYNPREGGDEFKNPAIDKANPGGASNNPTNPIPKAKDGLAVRAMLKNLIGVECNRVTAAAKTPDKFFAWLDTFYAQWSGKMANAIEELGGDRELATDYCEESKRRLIEASECQPNQLYQAIVDCVESWPSRVNTLSEGILVC